MRIPFQKSQFYHVRSRGTSLGFGKLHMSSYKDYVHVTETLQLTFSVPELLTVKIRVGSAGTAVGWIGGIGEYTKLPDTA